MVLKIGARHTIRMRMSVCACVYAHARKRARVYLCVCNTCVCVHAPSAEGGKGRGNSVCRGLVTGEDAACCGHYERYIHSEGGILGVG